MTDTLNRPKPVVLCILDGWGESNDTPDNAISAAHTPFWDEITTRCPKSVLETSGLAVGLSEGQMGNSEVGHMNIGSGRVVMQNLPRIDLAIADGSLAKLSPLRELIAKTKASGGTVHVLGLLSPGGVHSHQDHMSTLASILAKEGLPVAVHAFLDGRDTPPASAVEYLTNFRQSIEGVKDITLATATGRYYAMDRDKRWERVQLAYDALTEGKGQVVSSFEQAITQGYANNTFDEFVKPLILEGYHGMKDGDSIIMANFRSDRARQLLDSLLNPGFTGFSRNKIFSFANALGMVEYSTDLNRFLSTLFPSIELTNILGQVISEAGLTQLRIAETEKYAHVTFFFNGGVEEPYAGEERILIPSPKVATYDLKPEMSAPEVTDALVKAIDSRRFDLVVANYANTDMVGHTGIQEAAIKAVETIDRCLRRVADAVEKTGGCMFISADHGNCEQMHDDHTNQPHTAHTTNPVPFVMLGKAAKGVHLKDGRLCDIAPTILQVMGIKQPADMTGESLIYGQ